MAIGFMWPFHATLLWVVFLRQWAMHPQKAIKPEISSGLLESVIHPLQPFFEKFTRLPAVESLTQV
jgi:hypothetical protein